METTRTRTDAVERNLYRSEQLGVGRFECSPDRPEFPCTDPLQNDLFVFVREPLWWNRGVGGWGFLGPGAVVMHRKGAAIRRRAVTAAGDRADFFAVTPELFEEALISAGADPDRVTTMTDPILPDLRVRAAQRGLIAALEQGEVDALEVEARSFELLDALAHIVAGADRGGSGRAATVARRQRLVDRARALLDANLAEPLTMNEIAREAGASVFHLCRAFRERTGMTLGAYRLQQRVGAALDRLAQGNDDLATLAAELGFANHSHMTRSFRRLLGIPPSAVSGSIARHRIGG